MKMIMIRKMMVKENIRERKDAVKDCKNLQKASSSIVGQ